MSDEEKKPQNSEPSAEVQHDHNQNQIEDDARALALSEALQSSFKIVRVFMVILAIAFVFSGITKVDTGEQALQLRFGKFIDRLEPGLHFAWPKPIDEIVKIPVVESRDITSDVGYRTADPDDPEPQDSYDFDPSFSGYTLTGDGNTVHIKATMNYVLEDTEEAVKDYEFKFSNITHFLQSALDSAVYRASAKISAMEAYTTGKTKLEEDIRNRINKVVNEEHKLPIRVSSVTLTVKVPVGVEPDFAAFTTAEQESRKKIDEARAEAASIIASAQGQAKVIGSAGQTAADRLLSSVQAESKSFTEQRPFYERNPELFQQRLVTETMQRVLTNAVEIFYLSGRQPRIWLNRIPEKPKLSEGEVP
jgi:membrane protease subunit HflK